MKLSDFYKEGDGVLDRIDYPLFRAMAAMQKVSLDKPEYLEVTEEEFPLCMRYATTTNVYYQDGMTPIILGMRVKIL